MREPDVLRRLRVATDAHPHAEWASDPEQTQFLALLAQMIGAKNVVEVGTFTGYTTCALALALPQALWVLVPLGLVSGFAALGITTVALAAARERAGALAGVIWVRVTAGFAVAQALSGFALAALFRATDESHAAVFAAGLVLTLAGLVVAWADWRWRWN